MPRRCKFAIFDGKVTKKCCNGEVFSKDSLQAKRPFRPEGWHHWQKEHEQTASYLEFENTDDGSAIDKRVSWSHQLTKKEAKEITMEKVFQRNEEWHP